MKLYIFYTPELHTMTGFKNKTILEAQLLCNLKMSLSQSLDLRIKSLNMIKSIPCIRFRRLFQNSQYLLGFFFLINKKNVFRRIPQKIRNFFSHFDIILQPLQYDI